MLKYLMIAKCTLAQMSQELAGLLGKPNYLA